MNTRQTVSLEPQEWQSLLTVLAHAQGPGVTWVVINPLLMKIGQQLQDKQSSSQDQHPGPRAVNAEGQIE